MNSFFINITDDIYLKKDTKTFLGTTITLDKVINRFKIATNIILGSKSFYAMPSSALKIFINTADGIAEKLLLFKTKFVVILNLLIILIW